MMLKRKNNPLTASRRKEFKLILFAAAFVLFLPSLAMANIPIPSLYGFGAPFFLTLKTVGAVFAGIVLIEAVIFKIGFKIPWIKSLLLSLGANGTTSIIGMLIAGLPCFLLVPLCAVIFLFKHFRLKWNYSITLSIFLSILPILLISLSVYDSSRNLWSLYVSLIPAYFLTVFIEVIFLKKIKVAGSLWRWAFLANVASYLLLLTVLFYTVSSWEDNPLLSVDYLSQKALSKAESGDSEGALNMIKKMRNLNGEYYSFYYLRELHIAEIFIKRGDLKTAQIIIEDVRKTPEKDASWDGEIADKIESLERRIQKAKSP
jgi:hypothetical protein